MRVMREQTAEEDNDGRRPGYNGLAVTQVTILPALPCAACLLQAGAETLIQSGFPYAFTATQIRIKSDR